MKLLFALLTVLTLVGTGCQSADHQVDVPDAVQAKFKSLSPDVKNVKWEKEDGRYEAEFEVNEIETEIQFLPDGNVFQIETEIEVSALPSGVNDYFNQNMPGKKIKEASKIAKGDGKISYEVEVDDTEYLFDSTGMFTGKEVEEEK